MDQEATGYGGRPQPTQHCVGCGPSYPQKKGTCTPTQYWPTCGQMAGWMKTPLGTAVDLGPGHIVLDGVPASSREKGTTAPLFSAHVYCGHGRPSQLLLSSCFTYRHSSVTNAHRRFTYLFPEGSTYSQCHVEILQRKWCFVNTAVQSRSL